MIMPFCASCGGGLHETFMLTGPVTTTLKLVGGLLGPKGKLEFTHEQEYYQLPTW